VDRAPLPPHERSWRHPSELGPPAHEPTSTSGRVIIATAATLSLLLIGLLVISMTPDNSENPQAISSTTAGSRSSAAGIEQPRLPLVTPIGDDGWGIATISAVKARSGTMSARLPSGEVVDVEIVHRDDEAGVTVVSLPTQTDGYRLAKTTPRPTDRVAVHGASGTQIVQMVKVATLDVEEGAAVVDDDGDLVGLCTTDAGTVEVVTVSTMPGTTTTTVPRQVVTVPTTRPPTTVAVTTVPAPTTTPPTAAPTTSPSTSPTSTPAPSTVPSSVPASTPGVTPADDAATAGSS
jgi:hypothetical protein